MSLHITVVVLLFVCGTLSEDVPRPCEVVETNLGGSVLKSDKTINIVNVDDQIAFLLTNGNEIYRTGDGGVTWINQISQFPDWLNGVSGVILMVQSSNPSQIYFPGNSGDIWITSDGGGSYRHINSIITAYQSFVANIYPHPTNSSVFAVDMDICTTVDSCSLLLLVTTDGGDSWIIPYQNQYPYMDILTWGPTGSPGHSANEFYGLYIYLLNGNANVGFYSTDLKNFTTPFGDDGYRALLYLSEIDSFALLSLQTPIDLYFVPSTSLTHSSLQKAIFPQTNKTGDIDNVDFIDTSQTIFLAVHKSNEPNSTLELFTSKTGIQFRLSLDNIFATGYPPQAEILKLRGLEDGIFLVNKWLDSQNVQTVVTSNGGVTWTTLTPPADELTNCPSCTLNFFGSFDFTGGLYAKINPFSLGLVIGVAMVGPSLSNNSSLAHLYISRDAGKSWKNLRNGSWRFDTSPTTGFIALTKFEQPTTDILYTFDEGISWSTCDIKANSRNLIVDKVTTSLVAPLKSTGVWLLTHWVDDKGVTSYSVIHSQFNTSIPSCGPSDYEIVSLEGDCVLGQKTMIKRKKGSSVCKVDTSMNLTFSSPCNCTRQDYMCASCFVENSKGECILNDTVQCKSLENPPSDCPAGGNYSTPIGYVRVQGTKCINDLPILTPIQHPCPLVPNPAPNPVPNPAPNPDPNPAPNSDPNPAPNSDPNPSPNLVPNSESIPKPVPISIPPISESIPNPKVEPISKPPISASVPNPVSISPLPNPSSLSSNKSELAVDDINQKRAMAGYIALGVILGVILVVVVVLVVVKLCSANPVNEVELN